jgi:uncharacterized protein (TIGR02594 family)
MQLNNTNKSALITSFVVLALATTAFTVADARPRHARPQAAAAFTGDAVTDDRYAHVQSGVTAVAPMMQQASPRRGARQSRNTTTNTMSFGGSGLVAQARSYLGTNPTGMSALWCARFLNMLLERSGRSGTGSDMASSFASFGSRVSGPQVGAIAVMSRGKRGGHVGIVSGIDAYGNPIIISGNFNGRVGEAPYPRGRIYAYVMP